MALSVAFHLVEHLRHLPGYSAYPLSSPNERFSDFTIFYNKFPYFHTVTFFKVGFPINYPAPCAVLYEVFFRFAPNPLVAFLTFAVLVFVIPAGLFARALHARGISWPRATLFVASLTLFSWPVLMLIDRANVEVFVWLALLIGMVAYATGRLSLAATFFGIGASLKLFPFVLFGLFLSRRQYGKILLGAAVFLGVSLASLAIVGPSIPIAYEGLAGGMNSFKNNYMAFWRPAENGVDHSMFSFYKGVMVTVFHHSPVFPEALSVYLLLSAVGGLALYFLRIRLLPLLNQVLILTIASIYFTAFSGDGTLIHLYAPLGMIFLLAIQAYRQGMEVPGLRLMLGCLVFILSVVSFISFHTHRYIGPAKCIAIGILLLAALKYPLGPRLDETRSESILSHPDLAWLRPSRDAA